MSQCGTITMLIWADQLECQPVKELSDMSGLRKYMTAIHNHMKLIGEKES